LFSLANPVDRILLQAEWTAAFAVQVDPARLGVNSPPWDLIDTLDTVTSVGASWDSGRLSDSYDQGKAALDALILWAEANADGPKRNEATTRLHLIDELLRGVLQWPKAAIRAEEPAGSGFIDYAIGSPATQFIVEAKREGAYFDLPVGTSTGVHSIQSITDGAQAKPLRDALEQVISYTGRNGVAPAGVTNGRQLVLFIGARTDGVPPLQGKALVFPDLVAMRKDFRLLWDNASPVGIDQRVLHRTVRITEAPPPESLSSQLPNYPGVKRRNDLQAGLDILGELFLEDVARIEELREDFLRDCYASSGALSQYAEISKQILQTRYALLHEESGIQTAPADTKKGISKALTQDMLAAAASQRPIVLLGDVGVGKTMFIQRLVYVDAQEIFKETFSLYIDFAATTTLSRFNDFVVREAARQLRERYNVDIEEAAFVEAVHNKAVNSFDRGVLGRLRDIDPVAYAKERINFLQSRVEDRPEHLKSSLEHLRGTRRRQIVIFLDNIDQRSNEDQEQVFLIANELAHSWPATVFVSLRPETFYSSSRSGTLSGYQTRAFTISPPRSDVMLQRRVDFALQQLRETRRLGSFPAGVTIDSESLQLFFQMLADNFRTNASLLTLIDNLAGGNMRLALSFVAEFIGSGHIDTTKMLDITRGGQRYVIPLHEFLRALLFGDGVYYDSQSSPIANLFRVTQPDGREHFLLPLLLSEVQARGERVGKEGYVPVDELFMFAQRLGFNTDQIEASLSHAVIKRLLDVVPRYSGEQLRVHYRITTVGAYTTRILLTYFAYVDAVLIDTPIVDEQYRNLIQDVYSLPDRLARAEYFRLYLDREWAKISEEGLPWTWSATSRRLSTDIRQIGRRTDRATWDYKD
jgi:GTPase SAR1 family protein